MITPERLAWHNMRARCANPNSTGFKHYGGRGIRCEFSSFEQFFAEIGPRPSPKHSVDRIDNDGHYAPGNVRWADPKTQAINRASDELTEILVFRAPIELKADEKAAAADHRTLSSLVTKLLREGLAKQRNKASK